MSANGDCYEAAGKYIMDECVFTPKDCKLILVHAEVSGQGSLGGVRYGHAFVLDGDIHTVNIDGTNMINITNTDTLESHPDWSSEPE